jgi:hypothetical protein
MMHLPTEHLSIVARSKGLPFPTDELLAFYKFDEASGDALDSWGANDLSEIGTEDRESSIVMDGNSLDCEAQSGYLRRWVSGTEINFGTVEAWTFSWWAYQTSYVNLKGIFALGNTSGATATVLQAAIRTSGGNGVEIAGTASQYYWKLAATLNQWQHWLVSYDPDADTVTVFRDNSQAGQKTGQTSVGTGGQQYLWIGDYNSGWGPTPPVYLDDFAIWNKALSADERDGVYNNGNGNRP